MRERVADILYAVGSFVVLLAGWEITCRYFEVPTFYVPAPSAIVGTLVAGSSLYASHVGITLYSTLVSFAIAMTFGVLLGTLVTEIRFFERTLQPLMVALQAMPRIALAPIIIVWFGFGPASKIALGAFTAFFPVFINTTQGMRSADNDQIAYMRSLKASGLKIFLKIKLPNSLPYLFAGANIAIIFSMLAVIVAEFLGANQGMGYLIVVQSTQMDTSGVMAAVFILSTIGVIFHYTLQYIRKKVLFWATIGETGGGGA